MNPVLLDTHAAVWLAENQPLTPTARRTIEAAASGEALLFSAVSAWEIGLLVAKGRLGLAVSAEVWVGNFLGIRGVVPLPLNIDAALESSRLPGGFHPDPADRLLVASARIHGAAFVTRDDRILAYAASGYLEAVPC